MCLKHIHVRKMYEKQTVSSSKGDQYTLLLKGIDFIGEVIDDNQINSMSKSNYKHKIYEMIKNTAFIYFMKEYLKHCVAFQGEEIKIKHSRIKIGK